MKRKEGRTVEGIAESQGQNKENEAMSSRGSLFARTSARLVAEFRSFVCDIAPE